MIRTFVSSLSFSRRLALILSIPLAGLLAFCGFTVVRQLSDARIAKTAANTVEAVAPTSAQLVTSLQEERLQLVALWSSGSESEAYWQTSGLSIEKASQELLSAFPTLRDAGVSEAILQDVETNLSHLKNIDGWRSKFAARDTTWERANQFYSDIIDSVVGLVSETSNVSSDAEFSQLIFALKSLLEYREAIAAKRDAYARVDAHPNFEVTSEELAVLADRENKARVDALSHATSNSWSLYAPLVASDGFNSDRWEGDARARAVSDLLDNTQSVESSVLKMLLRQANEDRSEVLSRAYFSVGFAALVALVSIGLSIWLASVTSSNLKESVYALKAGAEEVSIASLEVAKASCGVAESTRQQAVMLSETNDGLDKISSYTASNNVLSDSASKIASRALNNLSDCESAIVELKATSAAELMCSSIPDEFGKKIDQVCQSVGRRIQSVTKSIGALEDIVSDFKEASEEQLQGIEKIHRSVGKQEEVVIGFSAASDETAAAAQEMNAQAKEMEHTIEQIGRQAGLSEDETKVDFQYVNTSALFGGEIEYIEQETFDGSSEQKQESQNKKRFDPIEPEEAENFEKGWN